MKATLSFLLGILLASSAYGEMATILLPDNWVGGTPGGTVEVPVRVQTSQQITSLLISLEFDSTRVSFQSAVRGSATSNFTLFSNPDPAYSPTSPGTNKSLRLLIFGGGSKWFTGDTPEGAEVVRVTFAIDAGATQASPIAVDLRCESTSMVSFSPVIEFCNPDLAWGAGNTVSDTPTLVVSRKPILHQNVPNPFNPSTAIAFEIPMDGWVQLQVFNVKGQLVRTLIDATLDAGPHSAGWNGLDDSGNRLSSGYYFYHLSTPEGVATRRALLLK